ncbi:Stp1/IreP family PP2C-type Ser/Thr phosphatase [Vulgatibacter sp.]|uniref:Stp1/IreP family PP2C-type Ser/Thr phosphatase n=1 Tax=Vulgatibacter sp. TaxID=1971226 RepID=UPI0035615F0F
MNVASFGLSDVGRKRQHNEDAFLADDGLGLYIVCDGMGGHAAGEVAAARTTEVIREHVAANHQVLQDLATEPSPKNRAAAVALVEAAVQKACAAVYHLAQADAEKRGMGTTCVVLLVAGEKAVIGHVGDSRIYLLRNDEQHQLTEDHTLVQAQLKQGVITPEQALVSPYRNVITRAVGIQESVQVDTLLTDVVPGDVFLLCSDGLHGYLADDEGPRIAAQGTTSDLAQRLVDLANDRGGKDNVTALVVATEGPRAGGARGEAEARLEAMRKIPLFQHLSYKEQMAVLAIANARSYAAGQEIVREGAPAEQLFVVVKGRVVVEATGTPVAELRAGAHFGEMGLIDQASRSATVRALEPTRCVVLGRLELLALMRKEPVLAVKLLWSLVGGLAERLRATNAELAEARQGVVLSPGLPGNEIRKQ